MHDTQGQPNYLSNPYFLLGGALLIYWFYSRKKILAENPNATSSFNDLESSSFENSVEYLSKKFRVPKQLVKDTKKMSKKQIATTIIDNQKMINKTKMSNDERKHILGMVEYLEYELDKKM
jgi:hypothetical protein